APRRRKPLDEIDLRLIRRLAEDPRISQTALASELGVMIETVSARLKRLRTENIIATTIVVDWEAAGWRVGAIARLRVSGEISQQLLDRVCALPGMHYVALATGCCDLVCALVAVDLVSLRQSIVALSAIGRVEIQS